MALQRRSRMHRTRTGKRLALSERDIAIFRVLSRYRYLRSTYIHAFVGGLSETRIKERLGDLFHEGYIDRPRQQWEFASAQHCPVVYELGAGARRVLGTLGTEDIGSTTFLADGAHRQFLHALMICEALASFEWAASTSRNLRFIGWPEILAKAPEPTQRSHGPIRLPVPSGGALVPDGVFGLEYVGDGAKKYRFFALEADRGTMPIQRSKPGQTSYLGKLALYGEAIAAGLPKSHWGVPNLFVLTLTNNESRLANIIDRFEKQTSPCPRFLFAAAVSLTTIKPELVTEPWRRAGQPPLSVDRAD